MQYTIVIDKQPSTSPSTEKKEYTIDIEELRTYQGVSDTLKVTPNMAYVIRRLALSKYGILSILDEPKQENIKDLNIELFEGTNYIYILNEQGNNISASYVIKTDFTDAYPTKAEMNSAITQSASSIEISVNTKLEDYSTTKEMNSAIKQTADSINLEVSKKVNDEDLTGANITLRINKDTSEATINADKININGAISANGNFKVDTSGNMQCNNATITGGTIEIQGGNQSSPNFSATDGSNNFRVFPTGVWIYSGSDGGDTGILIDRANSTPRISVGQTSNPTVLYQTYMKCQDYQNYSLESIKKNISHYNENALETILNSDIYSYNLKIEKDTDKKHIGFVIGDNYKTPKEVMNNEGNAIELYSAIGILWKGMQEQQKRIEELENKLKEVTNG